MAATPCGAHHSGIFQPADIVKFTHKTAARWKAHPNALLFGRISAIMFNEWGRREFFAARRGNPKFISFHALE
ncbi:hypothetical protein [Ruegeria sp. Ofav3-42]|uniref:hypothetical protein n=1 Tax=Ruegeria sp. Ofav3-42 TaxID=2917759 RepID=UPI001EF40597|nr:hypothetical protein [Ruegeria sp. Ofav3-42]MCG7519508.1 hypothetical protein [Ruegeria sp. Ofav3-42]